MIRPLYYHITNKNIREFNRLYSKWGEYDRYKRVNNIKFLNYRFDIPDLPSFVWQFKELFVDEIYKFKSSSNTPIIVDCGANIGTSCLYFKSIYPNAKIVAFEADKTIANILKSNLYKNGIDDVNIINSAVWIDNNGIEFSNEGADGGSIYGKDNLVRVNSVRLKDYIDSMGSIDLLRIDIEGAEYEVLKDIKESLKVVENIFVEYHSWNNIDQNLSEILHIFEDMGYRYYIEDIKKREHPFIDRGVSGNMDLQLNIFGVKR
jgi:FkbM family methyltransferase